MARLVVRQMVTRYSQGQLKPRLRPLEIAPGLTVSNSLFFWYSISLSESFSGCEKGRQRLKQSQQSGCIGND